MLEPTLRRSKRWLKRAVIVLMLGTATTLGIVAIGPEVEERCHRAFIAPLGHPGVLTGVIETDDEDWFQSSRLETWTSTEYRRVYLFVPGTAQTPMLPADPVAHLEALTSRRYGRFISKMVTPDPGSIFASWVAEERGFPFRCVWTWRADAQFANPHGKPLASAMPLVHWDGMIGNLLVWSVAWSVLWLAVLPLRRFTRTHRERVRRERGLCTRCGYPVGTGAAKGVCPECGGARTS